MVDPQAALIHAIAYARQMQQPPSFQRPGEPPIHPQMIHQIASQLASRIAGGRQALGQANVGMFPQSPQGQGNRLPAVPLNPNPNGVGYAPDGNAQNYAPQAADNGATDNGFFVRPVTHLYQPGQLYRPGVGALPY